MKIAIACFNLFTAGGARLVFNLAKGLKEQGQTVIIYTPELDDADYRDLTHDLDIRVVKTSPISYFRSEKPKNVFDWVRLKMKHEREFLVASRALASAMENDFDVVSIHDSSYRVGYYYKKRNPNVRVVWTVNGPPFRYLPRKKLLHDVLGYSYQFVKRLLNLKFMRVVDVATVLANDDGSWLANLPIKKVSVVRAGLDFKKFYAPVKDFKAKAAKKSVRFLALGALNVFRRYENVLEAMKILRDQGYDARAAIVANNIWNENAYKEKLLAYIKENKLEDFADMRFSGVSEGGLARVYQESDVFIQAVYVPPPGHHGWGLVNFEAMAAGLPVILCRAATATEVLHDGEDALFVDPLASEQIARQAKKLVDDPIFYSKVANAGQAVAKNMSWEKYAEEMLKTFQK